MNAAELVVAGVLAALGVRSAAVWARRPFAGTDIADHALYALHVTGRVGLWFAFAAIFLLFGTSDAQGRAFIDEMREQRWLVVVVALLGAAQLLGGWFLGRRRDDGRTDG
jgi:hypothetical protein